MDKLMTIIVPSYNMEGYLAKAIDSLVKGNPLATRLDVIVVNDGSKDRTLDIAREYEEKFPTVIRVINKANGNYGSCINAGLSIADGLYVKILDADDTYDTESFVRYLNYLDQEIQCGGMPDVIFNDFMTVDEDGKMMEHYSYAFTGELGFKLSDFDYKTKPMVWNPAIAYKLELLRKINYRQSEGVFYSDQQWDTIPMLAVRTTRYCSETVYRYLIGRPGQSCNNQIRLKNFAMHLSVAIEILRSYAKYVGFAPEENLMLVRNQQRFHIFSFYWTYLISAHRELDDSDLIAYDSVLRECAPDLYVYAATLSENGFLYVREWRKNNNKHTIEFMMYYFWRYFRYEMKFLSPIRKFVRWICRHSEFAN